MPHQDSFNLIFAVPEADRITASGAGGSIAGRTAVWGIS